MISTRLLADVAHTTRTPQANLSFAYEKKLDGLMNRHSPPPPFSRTRACLDLSRGGTRLFGPLAGGGRGCLVLLGCIFKTRTDGKQKEHYRNVPIASLFERRERKKREKKQGGGLGGS